MPKNTQNLVILLPGTYSLHTDWFLQSVYLKEIRAKRVYDPYVKWPFWHQEQAITRGIHVPLTCFFSRIDSSKCPLQKRVLRFRYIFCPKPPEWPVFGSKKVQKLPKRVKNAPKRPQKDVKTVPKWSPSDPKMTPVRPKNSPKSPQNDPILGHFDPFLAPKRSKNGQKGSKVTKNRSKVM